MRVEERVAQERGNAFPFGLTHSMLHAMGPFVPLGRSIARMFGQILLVDAVGSDEFKSMFSSGIGEL